jgi:hypothetical protein
MKVRFIEFPLGKAQCDALCNILNAMPKIMRNPIRIGEVVGFLIFGKKMIRSQARVKLNTCKTKTMDQQHP